MRIYQNFREAIGEIIRDVKEMGVVIRTTSYQNKVIENDDSFETLELTNYMYTVTGPREEDLNPIQPWADIEFEERLYSCVNPGEAWKHRSDVWTEFLNEEGQFDYTYSERFNTLQLFDTLIQNLKVDKFSRQHYISIWNPRDIKNALGKRRIPCSLGYLFQVRQGALNITYLQRSADLVTHFENDIYLAFRLQKEVASILGESIGQFTHWLGSIHVFKKDVKDVF